MRTEFLTNGDDDEVQIIRTSQKAINDFDSLVKEELERKGYIKPTNNLEYSQERKQVMIDAGIGDKFKQGIKGKTSGDTQRKSS